MGEVKAAQMEKTYSPEIGVGIAIIEKNKILLTKRQDYPVWCIPGGHLSSGESFLDAAVREAKEETGLEIQIISFVGFYSMPHKWKNGSCEVILRGNIAGGRLIQITSETVDAHYFTKDELPKDLLGWQFHEAWDALSGKTGVLAVLDTHLSMRQLRQQAARVASLGASASRALLDRLCERPERIDLPGTQAGY